MFKKLKINKIEYWLYLFILVLVLLFTFFLFKRINRLEDCKKNKSYEIVKGKVIDTPFKRAKQMRVNLDFSYKGVDYQHEISTTKEYNYYITNDVSFDVMICECNPNLIFLEENIN